jgi:hypothetical protein
MPLREPTLPVIPAQAGIQAHHFVIPANAGIQPLHFVIPANAGIHFTPALDSRLCGNDGA